MILSDITILASTILFFAVTIILVVVLLIAKKYLVPSGNVKITINDKTDVEVPTGDSLLSTLANQKIYLPSACGGGGSCGQCRVRIPEGGGEALPTEKVHFSRKELMDNWHLGCQVKVKNDMKLIVPESVLGVKEWECEVMSPHLSKNSSLSCQKASIWISCPALTHKSRFLSIRWTTTKTSTRASSVMNICRHGKNSDYLDLSAGMMKKQSELIPWPTILRKATASCSPSALPLLRLNRSHKWVSKTLCLALHHPTYSRLNLATKCL